MGTRTVAQTTAKLIFLDIIGDFIFFPLWWYTAGLKNMIMSVIKNITLTADHLAIRLLILNIFKPMFAQYDRTGRIISFFMRIVILIGRLIYFFVYSILQVLLLLAWILTPVLIIYRLLGIYLYSYVAG